MLSWRHALRSIRTSTLLQYALITMVAAGAALLTVPMLIAALGIEAYGRWTLIESSLFFASALLLLGVDHGAIKQIAHDKHSPSEVIGALLPITLVAAVPIGGLIFVLARTYFGGGIAAVLALTALAEALLVLAIAAARADGRTLLFGAGQIGRTLPFLAVIGAALIFGWMVVATLEAAMTTRLVLLALVAVALLAALRPLMKWAPTIWGDAARYGGFILLTSLLALIIENADRFFIEAYDGLEAVGSYVVHVKLIALIGQAIITPFMLWFPAERFRHMQDGDGGSAFFARSATAMLAASLWAGGGLYLMAPWFMSWLAPGIAFDPISLAWLVIGVVFGAMAYPLNVGLLKPGRTHLNLVAAVVGACVALASSAVLTPSFGTHGAAAGRVLGLASYTIALWLLSQRHHSVDWNYPAMAGIVTVLPLLCLAVGFALPGGGWLDLVRGAVFGGIALPVVLIVLRVQVARR